MKNFPMTVFAVAGCVVAAVSVAWGKDIILEPGTYEYPDGLVLGPADSGTRYIASGKGEVRFTRSIAAKPGKKVACSAPVAPDAENFGSTRAHAPMFFYDHRWAVNARWPNEGWARYTKAAGKKGFVFDSTRPSRWNFEEGVYLAGYFAYDWAFEHLRAEGFDATPSNGVMRTRCEAQYGFSTGVWGAEKGRRFYAYNVRAELDAPGEYYYDRKTGKVDFIAPAGGIKEFRAAVSEGPIVRIEGAKDVEFRGIVFEYAVGDGLSFAHCTNCVVANCQVKNVGGHGIVLRGGKNCRVTGTLVDTTGLTSLDIDAGDRWSLTRADHVVQNCELTRFGTVRRTYAPGVLLRGVGTSLVGNRFHEAPHSAVIYGGNEHLLASNEAWRVLLETGDAGVFYSGRDPLSRGNVLAYNYIHDIGRPEDTFACTMAFYLDDCDAGDTIVSNRVVNVARGLMLGGGQDNHIIGNVFEGCRIGLSIDARGVTWKDHWDNPKDPSWQMTRKVKEMKVDREPWRSKYPNLLTYLSGNPREPRHVSVVGNVFKGCEKTIVIEHSAKPYEKLLDIRDNSCCNSMEN